MDGLWINKIWVKQDFRGSQSLSGKGNRFHLCTLQYTVRTVAKEVIPLWHKILFSHSFSSPEVT